MSSKSSDDGRSLIDVDSIVKSDRVHRSFYTSPQIFDAELRRIFARIWVFVGHESEVPYPGDYKTTHIGRQPVIMSRYEDGKVYVMYNRCMHRGPVVCREERGNSKLFRCVYHGWTYRNNGTLSGVPFRSGYPEGFDFDSLSLMRLPRVDSYRGFVFASLSPEGNSLKEFLGPMTSYIDRILSRAPDGEIEARCGVQKYEYFGNWKFQIENFVDHYHAPFTHESSLVSQAGREGYRARFLNQDVRDAAEIRAFAHGHVVMDHPRERRADLTGPSEYVRKMEEVYGKERAAEILTQNLHLAVFPNLLFQEHSQSYRVVLPVSVDRTRVFVYPYRLKGAPDGYNSQRIRAVTLTVSATGFMQPDDLEALTRAQEGLQAEGPQWVILARGIQHESSGPFGERVSGRGTDETGIRGLCRYWKELMDASGGQP